jgi:hypothetical protein
MVRPTSYLCTLFLDSAKKVAASTSSIEGAATRFKTTNLVTICCKISKPQRDTFPLAAVRSPSYKQPVAISYKMKSNDQSQVFPTCKMIKEVVCKEHGSIRL